MIKLYFFRQNQTCTEESVVIRNHNAMSLSPTIIAHSEEYYRTLITNRLLIGNNVTYITSKLTTLELIKYEKLAEDIGFGLAMESDSFKDKLVLCNEPIEEYDEENQDKVFDDKDFSTTVKEPYNPSNNIISFQINSDRDVVAVVTNSGVVTYQLHHSTMQWHKVPNLE